MHDAPAASSKVFKSGRSPARLIVTVAVAALLLMQQVLQLPGISSLQLALHNAAHTPLFLLLTLLLWQLAAPFLTGAVAWKFLRFAILVAILAALTEVAQLFTGRDASYEDWARDMLGVGAALALIALRELRGLHAGKRLVLGTLCGALLCAGFLSVFQVIERRQLQAALAPELLPLDAELLRSMSRIRGDWRIISHPDTGATGRALELQLNDTRFPGLMLREPFSDWRAYEWLELDVEFPRNADYVLTVRVETFSDRGMDRIAHLQAVRDRTRFRIPLTQLIDGSASERDKIKNLLIFTDHKGHGQTLLIHGIRLLEQSHQAVVNQQPGDRR